MLSSWHNLAQANEYQVSIVVGQPTVANLAKTNERRVSLVVGQLWPMLNERRVSSEVGQLGQGQISTD